MSVRQWCVQERTSSVKTRRVATAVSVLKATDGICVKEEVLRVPAGFFVEMPEDEMVVLPQMFFAVIICALATLAAKGDLVFTAIFIGAVAAMTGYWFSERSDRVLEGFKSR